MKIRSLSVKMLIGGCFLVLALGNINAQTLAPPGPDQEKSWDLSQLLGMTPPQAIEILGPPSEVYTLKVAEAIWQPVFYYPQQIYLFFQQNRVWQVRMDRRYGESFQGISMGMSRESVLTILGSPKTEDPGFLLYDLPYSSFPRRWRIILTEGKVSDIFIYRSDF